MGTVAVMSERTHSYLAGLTPARAEAFMDDAVSSGRGRGWPPGWPENADIVIDNAYPVGVVTIWEREDYDRMLELQDAPPAELQRWMDLGERLRHGR